MNIKDKFTNTMKVLVLIADIVSSKKISNRSKIQNILKAELERINKRSGTIISPMTITLGDEFQCVYSGADEIFNHAWEILLACYPERIRFSFGLGPITTAFNRKQAIGMDGPAFYEAREGLTYLKRKDYLFNITVDGKNDDTTDLIRNALHLMSHSVADWKKNRIEIMNMLTNEIPVKLIAVKLKISEQAVYKNITSGGLQPILDVTKSITGILNNLVKS